MLFIFRRAGEPANFLLAPAPAPDFFSKRLRLLVFFQVAPAPAPRSQKHPAPTGSGSSALDGKYYPWLSPVYDRK